MSRLTWPWLVTAVAAVVLVAAVLAWRRRGDRATGARWVANTAYLDGLPGLRQALLQYQVLRGVGVGALVVAVLGAGVLAARPVERVVTPERLGTRDIVLCLDVSGSMVPFDSAIVATFARLVESFAGERIALSIFNSTSRTVFPLTDDYGLVLDELAAAEEALSFDIAAFEPGDQRTWQGLDEFFAFVVGTDGVPGESSLIGDGLASCALLFDAQETERSRSIILATDNDVLGVPIYTLPDAVALVGSRDVQLYGLYGGDVLLRGSPQNQEFTESIADADGLSWFAEDPAAVEAVLSDVAAQQAVALADDPRTEVQDRPQPWFTLLLGAVLGLLLLRWRLRS